MACTTVERIRGGDAAAMTSQADTTTMATRPTFGSIVCGVDDSAPSLEAARQAALLTDHDAALRYASISSELESPQDAHRALRRALDVGVRLGAGPTLVAEHAEDPSGRLLELAGGHDLLVVGIGAHSRAAGIALGSTASIAVHRSPVPVLVARRPPDGVEFPARILLASDGTPLSDGATELAARIAARHGSSVFIVAARDGEAPFRQGLAEHAAEIVAATGIEPEVLDEPGPAHRAVARVAREVNAALIVTGSRGLTGVSALRSVSERIAHAAPCSVLVARR